MKIPPLKDIDEKLSEIFGHVLGNEDDARSTLSNLDQFIAEHPDNSDAYFLRAYCQACVLKSNDYSTLRADVQSAMSHSGNMLYKSVDYYSLLGKIDLETGHYQQAIEDLEKAINQDLTSAVNVFNIQGVGPEKTSKPCTWNLADFDSLVSHFPRDYRARMFRGLYYKFFTTYNENYNVQVLAELQRAALINPKAALPQFFIGDLYTHASFWTKKAWASDQGRNEATRSSVQAYTRAIQLDPEFRLAYLERAEAYLNLKQYPQAIKDFDKALALDPENSTAYADRGVAKLENEQYFSAISDFDDALRLKG